jgi:pilus assembly protein Flp/PilA
MNESHIYRIQTQRGQTMLEYLLLVALIAVGSIGIVTILGDTLRVKIQNAANRLAGESESIDARQVVKDSDGKVRRNIGNFNH